MKYPVSRSARTYAFLVGASSFLLSACGPGSAPPTNDANAEVAQSSTDDPSYQGELQNGTSLDYILSCGWVSQQLYSFNVESGAEYLKVFMSQHRGCSGPRVEMSVKFGSAPDASDPTVCNFFGSSCEVVFENPTAGVWWVRLWPNEWTCDSGETDFSLLGAYGGSEVLSMGKPSGSEVKEALCLPLD